MKSSSRRPLKDLNQKQINPFSKSSSIHTGKISRPGLDAAFVYKSKNGNGDGDGNGNDKGKGFGGNTTASTNANTDTDISINNDADSSSEIYTNMNMYEKESSIVSYSELDMSIGARAAIYEQSRHVAKYGLDGDGNGNGNSTDGDSPSKNIINSHLNDEWDRIMDGANMSQASFSSTFIAEQSFSHSHANSHSAVNNSNSSFLKGYNGNVSSTLDENMPLDMSGIDGCGTDIANNNVVDTTTSDYLNITCDQSDFFNTSRVANLRTPEKNKAKVDAASRQARMRMLGVEIGTECEDEHEDGLNRREKGTGGGGVTDLGSVANSVINGVSSFPSIMMDRLQKSYSNSVSGSASGVGVNDSSASGMIGLFNAALRMGDGLDMNDQSLITKDEEDDDDHHHNKNSSIQNDETTSFISYQEPNLSVAHDSSFKVPTIHDNDDDNNGNDNDDENHHHHHEVGSSFGYIGDDSGIAQESFISYREPDLSMVSNHSSNNRSYGHEHGHGHGHGHGHDDRQDHSDFNVDVSEIIAPNELEHKLGGIHSHAGASASKRAIPASPEHVKGSSPRPLYPPSTPVRLSKNSISSSPGGKLVRSSPVRSTPGRSKGWPPLSPHGRLHQQRQSKNSTGNSMNTDHTRGSNTDKRQQIAPQESPTFGTNALELKANVSLLSPIENKQRQRYNDSREAQTPIQIEPATPQGLSSLSSHSRSHSIRYTSREDSRFEFSRVNSQRYQQQQNENSIKQLPQSIPRKISLRERYTRADRFLNDDFSLPSSASTLEESSPQTLELVTPQQTYEEAPVNRSLLDTFDKSTTTKRRFEI